MRDIGGTAACSASPFYYQTRSAHANMPYTQGCRTGARRTDRPAPVCHSTSRKEGMRAGSAACPRTMPASRRARGCLRTECSRMKPRELNLYSDTPSSASTLCGCPGARRGAQRSVQRTATVCVSRGHMRSTSTCGRAANLTLQPGHGRRDAVRCPAALMIRHALTSAALGQRPVATGEHAQVPAHSSGARCLPCRRTRPCLRLSSCLEGAELCWAHMPNKATTHARRRRRRLV